MTTSAHTLSIWNAANATQAVEAGTVLFDAIVDDTNAALVEAALEIPDALSEAERAEAEWLMGRISLGQWTRQPEI